MKIFTIILSTIAVGLIIFNATKVDFKNPFEGESVVALIAVLASLSVIVLLQILRISKTIERKQKYKN